MCTGSPIRSSATSFSSSPALRPSAASSIRRNSSNSARLPPRKALSSSRLPTTSTSISSLDKIVVERPSGLTLSPGLQTLLHGRNGRPLTFDSQIWGSDREGSYVNRQASLINAAAQAPESKRMTPRLNLARFYLARDMYPEAKGVLDVALTADKQASENASAIVLRAIAEVMMNRPDDALHDLSNTAVGEQHDAPLWRALAFSRARPMGEGASRIQERGSGGRDFAGRIAARRAVGRDALGDRGGRFRRRRGRPQRFSDHRGAARPAADACRADGSARRGHGA